MTKLLFTIDSALSSMKSSAFGRQLWYYEENYVFRVLAQGYCCRLFYKGAQALAVSFYVFSLGEKKMREKRKQFGL